MTTRMGYWVDMDQAYWTMDENYIDSVWWSLKRIFDKGLLVQDYRVSPYCPRCGTGLSDHELAQGYEDVVDASVYVRFPVTSGGLLDKYPGLNFLVWTTTPWTLISNTAAAVNPEVDYVVAVNGNGEHFVLASALVEKANTFYMDGSAPTSITLDQAGPYSMITALTNAGSFTAGVQTRWLANNNSTAFVIINAEL